MSKKNWVHVDWTEDLKLKKRVLHLIKVLNFYWINKDSIYTFRSSNSSSKAYARIWGLSKIWQIALKQNPCYIIEVLSQRFDKLDSKQKDRILLHELAHIPKNFSGSLLPHTRSKNKNNFYDKVDELFTRYLKRTK